MRLISCYIENFGKISDKQIQFTDGCNIFCEENGWGKSTLAAFIKVMFYGFANAGVRDDYENERKRFRPWQGGVYGGKITFELKGSTYSIERTFGMKDKEDTMSIRDVQTNLETDIFSDIPGVDIFKIDAKSFERSVFITQNDCETHVTDSINAKLGNLAENTDDINNFEKVDKKLGDLINSMLPTRKTGSISKLKSEIASLEQSVRQAENVDKAIKDTTDLCNEEKLRYGVLSAQREKDAVILKNYEEKKSALTQAQAYFHGKVPTVEEISVPVVVSGDYNVLKEQVRICALDERERIRLDGLTARFGDEIPAMADVESDIEKLKMTPDKKKINLPVVGTGAALLVLGLVFIFINMIAGIVLMTVGVVAIVCSFLFNVGSNQAANDKIAEMDRLTGLRLDIADYERLSKKQAEYVEISRDYEFKKKLLEDFIQGLGFAVKPDMQEQISEINLYVHKYNDALSEFNAVKDAVKDVNVSGEDNLSKIHENILSYTRRIDILSEQRDAISSDEELLELKRSELTVEEQKFDLLIKTKEFLGKAKISFTQKYMGPITKGFNKYYKILTGKEENSYHIDANSNLTVEDKGMQRDNRFMSTGCRDLSGICMRMAFIEAMYGKEKPFVVFDDPFVNLDKNKTTRGMEFLREISKDYQVIYFTCHESRKY